MSEGLLLTANSVPLLQDVERAYSVGRYVDTVSEVWASARLKPARVFRSHEAEAGDVVVPPDTEYRHALDLLFGGLSVLHAGGLGASSNREYSEPGKSAVKRLLEDDAVRQYTEQHYPYAPPMLVRLSMEAELPPAYRHAWGSEFDDGRFEPLYRRFLHLNARFISNEVIGDFIELLDDFYVATTIWWTCARRSEAPGN